MKIAVVVGSFLPSYLEESWVFYVELTQTVMQLNGITWHHTTVMMYAVV